VCYQHKCWFFHISCISALRICTIYVINVDDRSDRGRQTGQISSSQQIFLHRLGASSLSMCAFNAIVDFFHISCISSLRICTIHVINIANDWVSGRQRGQILFLWEIIWHRWGTRSLSLCAINAIVDFFTFFVLALCESAPFKSSTLIIAAIEAAKVGRFHPLNR
jgi:hypothetical protein